MVVIIKTYLRFLLIVLMLLPSSIEALSWSKLGHRTVVEIAERHLSDDARNFIDSLFPEGLANESSWMDSHRRDEEYAYTGSYHTMAMNHGFVYDPSWRMPAGGDCVTGLAFVDYSLANREKLSLSDSTLVFHIRMLIHIVGDMHCPCHCYVMPEKNHWPCSFRGGEMSCHSFYDHTPEFLYGEKDAKDLAAYLDCPLSGGMCVTDGSFIDWAQDCCSRSGRIYDITPYGCQLITESALEAVCPIIEESILTAGLRLAYLLNRYFGPSDSHGIQMESCHRCS